MKRLPPLSTYSSPSRRASVRIAAESEPDHGSDSAYGGSHSPLASRGSQRSFCSSVPASLIPSEPSSWTASKRPVVAQTFESSSIATSTISAPVPVPPYCSPHGRPKSSCSRSSSTMSQGNSADLSISAARGATRSRASVRTRLRISRCSSVSGSLGTAGSLVPVVKHSLDVVAVRIEDEGAEVAGVVFGALARRTNVGGACLEPGAVEGLDGGPVRRVEGEMDVFGHRVLADEREGAAPARDVEAVLRAVVHPHADRGSKGLVEAARRAEVADADPEVVNALLTLAELGMVNGLDAVAVWVPDEGAVVAGRVLRPRSGRAVVAVAGPRHRLPPGVDRRTGLCDECDVQVPRQRPLVSALRDREVVPLEEVPVARRIREAEGLQRKTVEGAARVQVGDANRDVVEHD